MKSLLILITFILFSIHAFSQSADFDMMNDEPGRYQVSLRDGCLFVNHGDHNWTETVESRTDNWNFIALITDTGAEWHLIYSRNESGHPETSIVTAWCFGEGSESIHYYKK